MKIITEHNQKWFILCSIGIMLFMGILDVTAVNLAMAKIADQFHIPLSSAQWLVNIIAIIPATIMIVAGKCADLYGKRRLFIISVATFTLASLISGLAPNETILFIGRFLQGFAIGLETPVAVAIIFSYFPEKQRGLAIGFVVTIIGLAQVVGPILGGVIIHLLNWRYIFFINLPLGIASILMTLWICPADKITQKKNKIDIPGGILLAISLILILFSLNEAPHMTNTIFFVILFAGFIILFAFYLQQKKSSAPLIEMSLLKEKQFTLMTFIRFLFNFAWMTIFLFLSLYLQNVLGYGALPTGKVMLSMMLLVAILAPFSGKLTDMLPAKAPMVISLIFAVIAYLLIAKLPANAALTHFIFPLFIYSISLCIIIPFSGAFALRAVPSDKISAGSGIYYTLGFGGAALGVACIGWLLTNLNSYQLKALLTQNHIQVSHQAFNYLTHVVHGTASIHNLSVYFPPVLATKILPIAKASFSYGFTIAMLICAVVNFIALILAFFL